MGGPDREPTLSPRPRLPQERGRERWRRASGHWSFGEPNTLSPRMMAVTFPGHAPPGNCVLLSELLTPERVRIPLNSRDKPGILRELSELLVNTAGGELDEVISAVEEREALLSTGIGFGVAIPHG